MMTPEQIYGYMTELLEKHLERNVIDEICAALKAEEEREHRKQQARKAFLEALNAIGTLAQYSDCCEQRHLDKLSALINEIETWEQFRTLKPF